MRILLKGHSSLEHVGGDVTKVYYLPHKEVIREHTLTTEVRIVLDASSRAKGCFSSNECLVNNEKLYADLVNILLRFRTHRIDLLVDIEKAFLQILIGEQHRDAFCFF